MKIYDAPMDIKLDPQELRILVEMAMRNQSLSIEERNLLMMICHHMIWDDLIDRLH